LILSDTNRYLLPGGTGALHLATVLDGLREYICFYYGGNVYIEEITGGHLEFIEDDRLAEEIAEFLRERGVLDISKPTLPDDQWLRREG